MLTCSISQGGTWMDVCIHTRRSRCVWSSWGIYNQQMSGCPLPPWGWLMLFQSVCIYVCVWGRERGRERMTRVLEVITTGGSSRKNNQTHHRPHVAAPAHTHGQDKQKSHKLCPDDWAPWVISLFLFLFWGLWVGSDGIYFLIQEMNPILGPQNPPKHSLKTVFMHKHVGFFASHQKTVWSWAKQPNCPVNLTRAPPCGI